MATFTARLNLRKPAGTDLITVSTDIGANMDILDNAAMINVANIFTQKQKVSRSAGGDSVELTDATNSSLRIGHPSAGVLRYDVDAGNDSYWTNNGGGTTMMRLVGATSRLQVLGDDNAFGPGAMGAALSYVRLGNLGDTNPNAYVVAGHGTVADANLILRPKGAGALVGQDSSGNEFVATATSHLVTKKYSDSIAINRVTGSYQTVLADVGKRVEMNVAGANTLTIPPNSTVAYPVGAVIEFGQYGAGQTTVTPGAGVTFRSAGGLTKTRVQYSIGSATKIGTDEWWLSGDLA